MTSIILSRVTTEVYIAAVLIISGMRLMYWSDGCLGRENRFYSIGVFLVLVVVSLLLLLLGIFLT